MDYRALFENWEDLREVRAGDTVFAEGDRADCMYFVLGGEIELRRHGEPTSLEGPGGIIGESALLGGAHSGNAVARSDARLARLDRDQLETLTEDNAEFALQVMAALAKRLRTVDAYISARLRADKND